MKLMNKVNEGNFNTQRLSLNNKLSGKCRDCFEIIYAIKTVQHIMSGEVASGAFRGHFLLVSTLIKKLHHQCFLQLAERTDGHSSQKYSIYFLSDQDNITGIISQHQKLCKKISPNATKGST